MTENTEIATKDDSIFFDENITFTDFIQDDFEETLAFVKDYLSAENTSISTKNHNLSVSKSQTIFDVPSSRTSQGCQFRFNESVPSKKISDVSLCSQQTDLKNWGLPSDIVDKYLMKGVKKMFKWQIECLGNSRVLNENGNLVYSAPTSAGKTLVAEILTIKTVLERQKKVLIILPFVSVVREKMFYFQDIFSESGIRVEGFMGSHSPPGGFQAVHIAICTIEKANSLVNALLENGSISDLGAVVVDELHLLGDSSRGYILELLLTKLLFVNKKYEHIDIQIIGMSATLPNLSLLSQWLNAELYKTDFRPIPLQEKLHFENSIFDANMELIKKIESPEELNNDKDNIIFLCLETISEKCSVLIFCPTKNWSESLAQQIASAFRNLGYSKSIFGKYLREQLDGIAISEVLEQLKTSPAGLDSVLCQTISFGVAFHHAGLTMDERDIIESAFKRNVIRVLVSTSTLSSGVNLPARRVIIRSPTFLSRPINILTYKQMVGRAGRMGIDTAGESILICSSNEKKIGENLISGTFEPVASCLEGGDKLLRAVLEAIASEVAKTPEDVQLFINCTLLLNTLSSDESMKSYTEDTIKELEDYELIRLQYTNNETTFTATALGKACLSSSMSPQDGLTLFKELQKARECFVLETDLHMIYLVTPYSICSQWGDINWMHFSNLWESLSKAMKRVGEMIGIHDSIIYRCVRGSVKSDSNFINKIKIMKRFYTALALQDLINEVPLSVVAVNFNCSRGMLQSLQQSASTFAGMVTAFSRQLGWKSFETLVSQFQDRLQFGIQSDLLDLMRLDSLNGLRARALFNSGIETICNLAVADVCLVENSLHSALPFQSEKERDGEIKYDVDKRNSMKNVWITGRKGVTMKDAAELLIIEARKYLQYEMGVTEMNWNKKNHDNQTDLIQNQSSSSQSIVSNSDVECTNVHDMETILPNNSINNVYTESSWANISNTSKTKDSNTLIENRLDSIVIDNDYKENTNVSNSGNNDEFATPCQIPMNKFSIDQTPEETLNCDLNNLSYRSNCSIFDSDRSKDLSLFEESIDVDTQLCKLLDKSDSIQPNTKRNTSVSNSSHQSFNDKDYSIKSATMLSIENAFAVPFEETLRVSVQSGESRKSAGDVILSSQEISAMEISLANTKIATPKRKMIKIDFTKAKRKKHSENTEEIDNTSIDFISPSPSKQINFLNHGKNSIPRNRGQTNSVLDFVKIGQYKKIKLPSYPTKNSIPKKSCILYAVDACTKVKLFKEYCSHILMSKTKVIYIDMESDNQTNVAKIGSNIVKSKNFIETQEKTNQKKMHRGKFIRGVAIYLEKNIAFYMNIGKNLALNVIEFLEKLFNSNDETVILYGCKYSYLALGNCINIKINCRWEDPLIADWLLDPESDIKSLTKMVESYCSIDLNVILKNVSYMEMACINAWATFISLRAIKSVLQEKHIRMMEIFETEMKALKILSECELSGMEYDIKMARTLINDAKQTQNLLEKQAFKVAGQRFRMYSPLDVAKVLGIYNGHKVSTNKKKLEKIENPLAQIIIYWRKLNSILTKNLLPFVAIAVENSIDTRIYGSYYTHTSTGRISMYEPNIQSMPRNFTVPAELLHSPDEKYVNPKNISCRDIFTSAKNTTLISADFCQLELRILAALSNDTILKKILMSDEDIFKAIAATWKSIPISEVDDDLRQNAKQICYGIVYGMGAKTLAQTLDICELEATVFMNTFHSAYPFIKVYTNQVIKNCKEKGYVETLSGRRRYLPLINSANIAEKSHAERQAVNTTIQGSAADILKSAMITVDAALVKKYGPSHDVKLVFLLHDELMYQVPLNKIIEFGCLLRHSMEYTMSLSVPLPTKIKCGSWGCQTEMMITGINSSP